MIEMSQRKSVKVKTRVNDIIRTNLEVLDGSAEFDNKLRRLGGRRHPALL